MLLKKLLLFFLFITSIEGKAQKKYNADSLRQCVLAMRYHSGFMFAHSIFVQNVKGAHPNGFEAEYSRLHTDSAAKMRYNSYPRSGFSFTYVNYNRNFLGKAYALSYFIEPNYRMSNRLKLLLRAGAGISYFNNPYDSLKNSSNRSYSTHFNSLLQLNLGISYSVNRHFAVYANAGFFHSSNGGYKQPNAGVNYINASMGLQYYTYSSRLPVYKHSSNKLWRHQPLHFDVALFYSPTQGYNKDSVTVRKFLLGAGLTAAKQVSNIDAITAAAEIYYDGGLRSIKEVFVRDSSSNVLAGLLVGHQFLLNRFVFSQELGFYIYKQTRLYNANYRNLYYTVYHRWGITYNIKKRWYVGINLLAHKQVADFIDARIIYRLR